MARYDKNHSKNTQKFDIGLTFLNGHGIKIIGLV